MSSSDIVWNTVGAQHGRWSLFSPQQGSMTQIPIVHSQAAGEANREVEDTNCISFDAKQQEHSTEEWECVKPEIRQLYLEQDLALHYVRDRLLRKRGFNATLAMYKRHLKLWNFKKTVSSKQKDGLVVLAKKCYEDGKALPLFDNVTGQAYDWHKVRRRDWEAGLRNELWKKVKLPPKTNLSVFTIVSDKDPTNLLLTYIKEYSAAFQTATSMSVGKIRDHIEVTRLRRRTWQMPVLFQEAIRLVDQGSNELAHLKFNEAGIVLQAYLNDMPSSLLPQLLRVVLDQNWHVSTPYQKVVFSFIGKLFTEKFGQQAALSRFISVLLTIDTTCLARDAVWKCVLDLFAAGQDLELLDVEELQFRYFWALSDSGYDNSVVTFCDKAIQDTYNASPDNATEHLRRKWRYHLGTVLERQGNIARAREMYQDALYNQILQGDDAYYNNIHIEALRSLGALEVSQQQWDLAAAWYKQALLASMQLRGADNARTLLCLDQLFMAYEKLDWVEETQELCNQYPISCHHLNRFGTTMSFH